MESSGKVFSGDTCGVCLIQGLDDQNRARALELMIKLGNTGGLEPSAKPGGPVGDMMDLIGKQFGDNYDSLHGAVTDCWLMITMGACKKYLKKGN